MLRSLPGSFGCWALGPTPNSAHTASQWCLNIAAQCAAARGFAAAPAPESSSGSETADSSSDAKQQEQQYPQLYAACVLERLPILKSPPPAWEASYKARQQLEQLRLQQLKQYPVTDAKQREAAAGAEAANAAAGQDKQPYSTAADASGAVDTMKRRLHDKLVLLVKAQHNALSAPNSSSTGSSGTGSSKGSQGSRGAGAGGASWTFPHTAHQSGETMRQAAERALREAIGLSQVYFVGNAPMAHLDVHSSSSSSSSSDSPGSSGRSSDAPGSSPGNSDSPGSSDGSSQPSDAPGSSAGSQQAQPAGRVFFHLAQVVNDPWDVEVTADVASGFAWVSKDELEQYIQDEQLLELARQML